MSTRNAARTSVPQALVQRFLALRSALPPGHEHPTYPAQNSHLKGTDLECLTRAQAELAHW